MYIEPRFRQLKRVQHSRGRRVIFDSIAGHNQLCNVLIKSQSLREEVAIPRLVDVELSRTRSSCS